MDLLIPHETPLLRGRLIARYVRFIAEIDLDDGRRVLAHCVNPGRMEGQVRAGARVWVAPAEGPKRKLKFTWVLMEERGKLVGVDTLAGYQVGRFFRVDLRPYDATPHEAWRDALASTSGWKRRRPQ